MSVSSTKYRPKDYLVEFGQVFQITKIVDQKTTSGGSEPIVHYRSYFPAQNQQTLFCSIPLRSLDNLAIRKPITKKEAQVLVNSLSTSPDADNPTSIDQAEAIFQQNDLTQTINLVKNLWYDKQDTESNFSSTKETAYEEGLRRISQELALVLSIPLSQARSKIFSSLRQK